MTRKDMPWPARFILDFVNAKEGICYLIGLLVVLHMFGILPDWREIRATVSVPAAPTVTASKEASP